LIEWGVAARTMPGETRSGDLHVVALFPRGVLIAVVDGLGHGDEAADAAASAADVLTHYASEPLLPLMHRCHEALRPTRGVAMSVASFVRDGSSLSWIGVGNVEATLFKDAPSGRERESMLLRGGVVGYRLPQLRTSTVALREGDTLVFATDGVERGAFDHLPSAGAPASIAEDLMARFGLGTDDALVLVARYLGEAA
jgi:hypothetical protein